MKQNYLNFNLIPLLFWFCSSDGTSALRPLSLRSINHDVANGASWRIYPFGTPGLSEQPFPNYSARSSRDSKGEGRKRELNYWNYKPSYSACTQYCDDGACMKSEYRCDGYAQCWDGSDEKGCACKDVIDDNKLCDGYKDCPDGKDEDGCVLGCQSNEFTCDTHNTGSKVKCIAMSKRCDGYFDCQNQNDEKGCYRMVDLNEEVRGVRSNGILQKLVDNSWYTVCKTTSGSHYIQAYAMKACEQVSGYTEGAIKLTSVYLSTLKSKMSKQQYQDLKYVRLGEKESKFAALGACASDKVYQVECPTPQCGGMGNTQPTRRRRAAKAVEIEPHDVEEDEDAELDDLEDVNLDDETNLDDLEDEDEDGDKQMIVGGYATEEYSWPFLVGIYRDGVFYCGGSIVNERWILTAAHCCHGYEKHVFEVQAGMTRRLSWSPYEQTRMVEQIIVHENYDSKVFANDIALYKLDKPLYMSKYVTPACLPSGSEDDPYGGQMCKVAGWGDLQESGSGPDHMQEVELPVLDKCMETFTRDSHQICAGFTEGGRDACQGDSAQIPCATKHNEIPKSVEPFHKNNLSGGPFLCTNHAGRPIVSGVVSFGRGCARAHEAGAYTRVSAYTNWIYGIINGDHPQLSSYLRPQQCTEKCIKPGGECLFYEDKCNGPVNCLGANDEIGCSHVVTRSKDNYGPGEQPLPYWGNYQRSHQAAHSMSRNVYHAPSLAMPMGPRARVYRPFPMLSRAVNNNRHERRTQCTSNEFQCHPLDASNPSDCITSSQVCNRVADCSDGNDELNCVALTNDFIETLDTTQLTNGELKGYVMARSEGLEWHPLALDDWKLGDGHTLCSKIVKSGTLTSLETIQLTELAERPPFKSLLEATILKSNNGDVILNQGHIQSADTKSENSVSKIQLNPGNVDGINFQMGYVKCAVNKEH